MYKVNLVSFNDSDDIYKLIHKWCSEKYVYEWFEQRVLSYDEIVEKYKKKLLDGKQELFLIKCDEVVIGLVQLYKYNDFLFDEIQNYKNIYEYDIFIGDSKYLHKGIGSKIINIVNKLIYDKYSGDCIVLRPFKRNINAIKCYQKNGFKIIKEYNGKDTIGNDEKLVVLIKYKGDTCRKE